MLSTRMTSAPMSLSSAVAKGPAQTTVISTTRRPSRGGRIRRLPLLAAGRYPRPRSPGRPAPPRGRAPGARGRLSHDKRGARVGEGAGVRVVDLDEVAARRQVRVGEDVRHRV